MGNIPPTEEKRNKGELPEITTCEKIEKVEHAKCHIEQQREIFGDSFMLNEGDAIRVADVDKAKEIMRSLNPGVKDDEQLMALLMDHIKGKPLNIHPDMLKSAQDSGGQVKQTLFPVGEPLAGADRNGYRATHEFRTQLTDGSAKVFTVVEMIVSPSVLAVADLMTETECLNLERLASEGNLYKESIASLMKVRMDQQLLTYIIPNDLGDVDFVGDLITRPGQSACFTMADISKNCYLMSLRMRSSAVCRCHAEQVKGIFFHKLSPGDICENLHLSNKRQGAVITFLSHGNGTLTFPAAGMEIQAKRGMSLYVPSVHPDTLPTMETETPCVPDLRTNFVLAAKSGGTTGEDFIIAIALISLAAAGEDN